MTRVWNASCRTDPENRPEGIRPERLEGDRDLAGPELRAGGVAATAVTVMARAVSLAAVEKVRTRPGTEEASPEFGGPSGDRSSEAAPQESLRQHLVSRASRKNLGMISANRKHRAHLSRVRSISADRLAAMIA